jgi:hypothetical protein
VKFNATSANNKDIIVQARKKNVGLFAIMQTERLYEYEGLIQLYELHDYLIFKEGPEQFPLYPEDDKWLWEFKVSARCPCENALQTHSFSLSQAALLSIIVSVCIE